MGTFSVRCFVNDSQYFTATMDGCSKMEVKAFTAFIRSLIREKAIHNSDSYSLLVCDLDRSEKRIFLSYLVSAEDLEWFEETESRLEAGFLEYKKDMQYLINEQIDDVYHEDMEEMSEHLYRPMTAQDHYGVRR